MVNIQLKNVPDELHQALKIRAIKNKLTLSQYLFKMIENDLNTLSLEEVFERLDHREKLNVSRDTLIKYIREDRDKT